MFITKKNKYIWIMHVVIVCDIYVSDCTWHAASARVMHFTLFSLTKDKH